MVPALPIGKDSGTVVTPTQQGEACLASHLLASVSSSVKQMLLCDQMLIFWVTMKWAIAECMLLGLC